MAVFQKYKGGVWYVNFRYKDPRKGKLIRFRRSTGKGVTKKQALKLEKEWKRKLETLGVTSPHSSMNENVDESKTAAFSGFAKYWLNTYAIPNNKRTEIVKKETILRVHLVPFFSDMELRKISPENISQLIAKKRKEQLASKTINNIVGCLRTMLNTATKWGYLEKNPANQVKPLKAMQPELDFFDSAETEQFLDAAKKHEQNWFPFFFTAFRTGLRLGELFALRWRHVDFKTNMINVRENYDGKEISTPKGWKGRNIPMCKSLVQTLKPLKGKRDELVFPDRQSGYLNRSKVKWPFSRIIKKSGLRTIRMHDMRHSFASQLVMKGVHLRSVQELLGHSDIRMTERYSHLALSVNQDAINLLD